MKVLTNADNRGDSVVVNALHREDQIAMIQGLAIFAIRALDTANADGHDAFD